MGQGIKTVCKRGMDLICVLPGLILLSPLLAAVALGVLWKIGRPVLFCQARPGLGGKPFMLYKFRTMTDARDASGKLLPDGMRLTPLGIFLRNASLDELPTLFNVLKGDMSLVGPRPLLMRYLPYYTPREHMRHDVRPGITGWAQVNGRNYLPWDERLALDVWYVDNWSLWLDLKILIKTFLQVLRREGVSADPDAAETDLDRERSARCKEGHSDPGTKECR
ncbi:sugar transferase [Syntrophotalea acetylenica]|uniref:sugar transferase n=1 Tax=Syntrophotalea acetylenica TaxID=29542 RepID=UPI002A3615CC|nr:sugar transferase [Syntrophotalea acetylenica]MDY0262758.1 sugar transferase [Syntrophotalea acetylenica]